MNIQKNVVLLIFIACGFQFLCAINVAEQFKQCGYVEIYDKNPGEIYYDGDLIPSFRELYERFDEFVAFLQAHPAWVQKLYSAKERFIRSKKRNYYSTDVFGFYDESQRQGRYQISFYYALHFDAFLRSCYPDIEKIPAIINFLQTCFWIQKPCENLFDWIAADLEIAPSCSFVLLKIVKYLPSYVPAKPHYDGSAFSCFLDSTDNESLLLAPYKSLLTVDDFHAPARVIIQSKTYESVLLIPGTFLVEFGINPTPHIVVQSGKTRYAAVAFGMRACYTPQKHEFSSLPSFINIE